MLLPDDGALVLAPSAGGVLRVPFGQISSVTEPEPFTVRITLADGNAVELTRLGLMRMPARWRVTDQVLVVGTRQAIADRDSGRNGSPREPLLRLRGTCLGGSFRLTPGVSGPAGPA